MTMTQITSQSVAAAADDQTSKSNHFDFAAYMANWTPTPTPRRNAVVSGTVVACDKQGFLVNIGMKADAFCPIDEADGIQIGDTLQFSVTHEPDDIDGPVGLSRARLRRWLDLQSAKETNTTLEAFVNDLAKAKGGNIAGVIATVNGVRGFIPRSELACFGKLETLKQTSLAVKVLGADPSKGRHGELLLSHKGAVEEEQDRFMATLSEGTVVSGQINHFLDKGVGVLVSIGNVTGLVHRTEMGDKPVKKGDEVQVKILKIDASNRRLSLSLKQVAQQKAIEALAVGEVITGTVARFTDYGVFVNLNRALDGLLHISEIPGKKGVKESYTQGQELKLRVLAIDAARGRVALSRRDLPKEA